MKAVTYQGIKDVKVKEVADAKLEKNDDILIRVTSTAICGSDLHLVHGMMPNFPEGYVIGHEPMGIVEEIGPDVTKVKVGDRVVIPFNISCGECFFVNMILKVNVTIQILTVKLVPILGILKRLEATLADKQSYYVFPMETLFLLLFQRVAI